MRTEKPYQERLSVERRRLRVGPVATEILITGEGPPLFFLHPELGRRDGSEFIEQLSARFKVYAPSLPGYDGTPVPSDFDSIEDLAYFGLDVLAALDLTGIVVIGVSLGAWIAAAMAIKEISRINRLALVAPVGVKFGARDKREIADLFSVTPEEFDALAYGDPVAAAARYAALDNDQMNRFAGNYEATARYAWLPYMYDPKLLSRLYRIRRPTLCVWGTKDRVVSEDYVRNFAEALPDGTFVLLPGTGHFPHIEDPAGLTERILSFAASDRGPNHVAACRSR